MWSFIYWTQIYTLLHLRIGSIYCIFQPLENNTVISAIMSWTTEAGRGQAIGMLDVGMRVWAVAVAFHVHGSSMYDPITLSGISLDKITEMSRTIFMLVPCPVPVTLPLTVKVAQIQKAMSHSKFKHQVTVQNIQIYWNVRLSRTLYWFQRFILLLRSDFLS